MKKPLKEKLPLKFKLSELLLLVFELNLFAAGLMMVYAAVAGSSQALYIPAEALAGMLPAILTVGFAIWLVYRLRCIRQAESRKWALAGAWCLGIVALSFGAGVGKLNMLYMSQPIQTAFSSAIQDPILKRAGLSSLLAFMSIGFIFGVTFVYKAARGPFVSKNTSEKLHTQLTQLSQQIVGDWSDSLVARIDSLIEDGEIDKAIDVYKEKIGASEDAASIVIADWPEQRLMLQVELLNSAVADSPKQTVPQAAPTA